MSGAESKSDIALWAGQTETLARLSDALRNIKRPYIVVHGAVGAGKTTVVRLAVEENAKRFTEIEWVSAADGMERLQPLNSELGPERLIKQRQGYGPLLVIDGVEWMDYADEFASKLFYENHYLGIILIMRRHIELRYANLTMEVRPPPISAWMKVVEERLGAKNADLFAGMLAQMGIKEIPNLAFPYMLRSFETWGAEAVSAMLQPIDSTGLFGADGKPVKLATNAPIIIAATNIEKQLINQVHRRPELVHELSPRKFEEFVAELMRQQGFTVELTPATRDGGKDIYLAAKTSLGSFLYLVECKQYKQKPVGIAPVQRLYGVLEGEKATAGLLVTTSTFTKPAEQFQEKVAYRLTLVDYIRLNKMISDVVSGVKRSP